MSEQRNILVAEDDESDVLLLQRAFKEVQLPHAIQFAHDGQAAIEFLTARCKESLDLMPSLLILDLKMPRRNGFEVLQWVRTQPVIACLPVMIFSSSSRREDVETAYALGANAFVVKPASTMRRGEVAQFIKAWLHNTEAPMASIEGYKAAQTSHVAHAFGRKPPG